MRHQLRTGLRVGAPDAIKHFLDDMSNRIVPPFTHAAVPC